MRLGVYASVIVSFLIALLKGESGTIKKKHLRHLHKFGTIFIICYTRMYILYHTIANFYFVLLYRMSTMEEEFQARYGTQRIESDEDDELLGSRDGGDDKIDYDDVIMTSSKCEGIRGSPPTGIREQMVDYQYNEHELDYDEMLDTEQGRPNPPSRKHQQVIH